MRRNVESQCDCMLCQVTGIDDYQAAASFAGIADGQAGFLGFDKLVAFDKEDGLLECDYVELERLWIEEIKKRKCAFRSK